MTYSVIDCSTNFVTRGKDCFVIHNLSVPKVAFIKDSTLIDKGFKYPSEFISGFAKAFKDDSSQAVNHVILTADAQDSLLRIMLFNREDS